MEENIISLAALARKGNAEAFGKIFAFFSADMFRYALYRLGNRDAAEDAVQEAALEAYKCIGKLKSEEAVKAWLFSILCRKCNRSLREKYSADFSVAELCGEPLQEEDMSEECLRSAELLRHINSLNDNEKEIILLGIVGGYNSKEIGKILSFAPSTVRSKQARALKKLKSSLIEGGFTK